MCCRFPRPPIATRRVVPGDAVATRRDRSRTSATSSSRRASPSGRPTRPGTGRHANSRCWRCTGCCICSATITKRDAGEMQRVEARLRKKGGPAARPDRSRRSSMTPLLLFLLGVAGRVRQHGDDGVQRADAAVAASDGRARRPRRRAGALSRRAAAPVHPGAAAPGDRHGRRGHACSRASRRSMPRAALPLLDCRHVALRARVRAHRAARSSCAAIRSGSSSCCCPRSTSSPACLKPLDRRAASPRRRRGASARGRARRRRRTHGSRAPPRATRMRAAGGPPTNCRRARRASCCDRSSSSAKRWCAR